jgi:hypothetical protein
MFCSRFFLQIWTKGAGKAVMEDVCGCYYRSSPFSAPEGHVRAALCS